MTAFDWLMLALGLLSLVAQEWVPKVHPLWRNGIAAFGFLALFYSGIVWLQDVTTMKLQTGPLTAILVGIAVVASGVFWHIHMSNTRLSSETPPGGIKNNNQTQSEGPTGIKADGVKGLHMEGNTFINMGKAMDIKNSSDVTAKDNKVIRTEPKK